jgi:hypothetical protein
MRLGEIALVPPERRVSGPNATWVMAPFTHINPNGSRFSNGSYGVYYAAAALETAISETAYHFDRIAKDSEDPPRREPMRVLVGAAACTLHDITTLPEDEHRACLDPDSYTASRLLGATLREAGSDGLYYPSVRHKGGPCIAVFWPDVVGIPIQERHLQYEWDGKRSRGTSTILLVDGNRFRSYGSRELSEDKPECSVFVRPLAVPSSGEWKFRPTHAVARIVGTHWPGCSGSQYLVALPDTRM